MTDTSNKMKTTNWLNRLILLIALMYGGLAIADDSEQKSAEDHVREYVDWQAKLMTAVISTGNKDAIKNLELIAGNAAKGMSASANAMSKFKLSEAERRRLWSVAATRQYELYGNRDMATSLEIAPASIRPEIMKAFNPHMEAIAEADTVFNEFLIHGNSGTGWEQVSSALEDVFIASIITIHSDPETKLAPVAITFRVRAEHPNDPEQLDSMVLFEHLIVWTTSMPTKLELQKWISYDKDKRIVTFNFPDGSVSYALPAKRKQVIP